MKKIGFIITAIVLMMGLVQNTVAQNPVKKVKYLKHEYEGEVNKKVPEGKGTMTFEGFKVQGVFQENEIHDATLAMDEYELFYRGSISYDESQKVTLKPGGEILSFVYIKKDDEDYVGFPVKLETIQVEKLFDANYCQEDINITNNSVIEIGNLVKELQILNPPTITKTRVIKISKQKIKERSRTTDNEKIYLSVAPDWDFTAKIEPKNIFVMTESKEVDNQNGPIKILDLRKRILGENSPGSISSSGNGEWAEFLESPDTDRIIVWDSGVSNVNGYKDNQGRTWYYHYDSREKSHLIYIKYPNNSFINLKKTDYDIRITDFIYIVSNNVLIDGQSGIGSSKYVFQDNTKVVFGRCQSGIQYGYNDITKVLTLFASDNSNNVSLDQVESGSLDLEVTNCDKMTDSEILYVLENMLFPYFKKGSDGKIQYFDKEESGTGKKYINIYEKSGYTNVIGRYYTEDKMYLSKEELKKRQANNENIQFNSINKNSLAKIEKKKQQFRQRFGFDPSNKSLRDLVKVGSSFSTLNDYFIFMKKLYDAGNSWNRMSWKENYPNESIDDYTIRSSVNGNPQQTVKYYYKFNLSIDHGTTKCYDFYSCDYNGSEKMGYVWVKGGKISTVSWY